MAWCSVWVPDAALTRRWHVALRDAWLGMMLTRFILDIYMLMPVVMPVTVMITMT